MKMVSIRGVTKFTFSFCSHLPRALDEFKPDVVVYNAGTDILVGDPLGILDISAEVSDYRMST